MLVELIRFYTHKYYHDTFNTNNRTPPNTLDFVKGTHLRGEFSIVNETKNFCRDGTKQKRIFLSTIDCETYKGTCIEAQGHAACFPQERKLLYFPPAISKSSRKRSHYNDQKSKFSYLNVSWTCSTYFPTAASAATIADDNAHNPF